MSILVIANKKQAGEYNFKNDPNNGAIGTVGLGVFIPRFSVITRFFIKVLETFTDEEAEGEVTVGFNAGIFGSLFVPINCGGLTAGTILQGVDFNANPTQFGTDGSFEVFMAIDNPGETAESFLTGGRVMFSIEYDEMDV